MTTLRFFLISRPNFVVFRLSRLFLVIYFLNYIPRLANNFLGPCRGFLVVVRRGRLSHDTRLANCPEKAHLNRVNLLFISVLQLCHRNK